MNIIGKTASFFREILLSRRMILCRLTGFSSGLPLYVLLNLVQAWLTAENVNIKTLGLFALVMFPPIPGSSSGRRSSTASLR